MSMAEHHVRRIINGLSCKEPEPETMLEWGRALARHDDDTCDRIVDWILKNHHARYMPAVGMVWKACEELGIRGGGTGKPKLWEQVPDTPDCDRCDRHGLVRVCGEHFTVIDERADGSREVRQTTRRISECPMDGMHAGHESPLASPPARPDEGRAIRYEKLFACSCEAGNYRVENTKLVDKDKKPLRLVQLRAGTREMVEA